MTIMILSGYREMPTESGGLSKEEDEGFGYAR